jgi:6,7-dimethyl-8-ribityllumazine synthase
MRIIQAAKIKHPFKIAIVVSQFNEEITHLLYESTVARLKEKGLLDDHITVVWVPGAVEIPLTAQRLAQTSSFAAVICLGAVIRGETTHYDYVCEQVSQGCQKVALKHNIPVIFGILTTENEAQAFDRLGGSHGNKGHDAADCALAMASILQQITIT